jgi:hypothetical protein
LIRKLRPSTHTNRSTILYELATTIADTRRISFPKNEFILLQ